MNALLPPPKNACATAAGATFPFLRSLASLPLAALDGIPATYNLLGYTVAVNETAPFGAGCPQPERCQFAGCQGSCRPPLHAA